MPFNILRNTICDVKPNRAGGIISADNSEVNFKNNIVSNIVSSTTAACIYGTNSIFNVENNCFTRCTAKGDNDAFGNVADFSSSTVKIRSVSAALCSYSTSYCGDSVFRFDACGASVHDFNSTFCHGLYGSATLRSSNNRSIFDVKFISCTNAVDYVSLECIHVCDIEKSSFINITKIGSYMIYVAQGSVFNSCYFFQMTTKTKFYYQVQLRNCVSDEKLSGYSLTVYSNTNKVIITVLNKPNCKGKAILNSCSKRPQRSLGPIILIFIVMS